MLQSSIVASKFLAADLKIAKHLSIFFYALIKALFYRLSHIYS